jgi:MFS family permease
VNVLEDYSLDRPRGEACLSTLRQAILLVSLPFGILDFVLPVYGQEIGADAVQIGLFFSVFFLMTVLLRPIVGVGIDRRGRRPFFLAGLAGYAVAMFTFASSPQVWGVVVARTVQGIASALLWLSVQAITADVSPIDGRARVFGSVQQVSTRGGILGTFAGFTLFSLLDVESAWAFMFLGCGVVSLMAALLAWRRLPETKARTVRVAHSPIAWSRAWILLLLVTGVTGASWAMTAPILMIFLQEKLGAEVSDLGWAFLPSALVWALLPVRLGRLADRFGRKPLMVLGMAMAAVSSFLVPRLGSLVGLAVLWALSALCHAAGDPAEQALVADLTDGDQRGRAYGLYALAGGLGAAAGPLVGGWLYEAIGPEVPFIANGVVLAVCALALGTLVRVPDVRVRRETRSGLPRLD